MSLNGKPHNGYSRNNCMVGLSHVRSYMCYIIPLSYEWPYKNGCMVGIKIKCLPTPVHFWKSLNTPFGDAYNTQTCIFIVWK